MISCEFHSLLFLSIAGDYPLSEDKFSDHAMINSDMMGIASVRLS